jgi:hypothetical protein
MSATMRREKRPRAAASERTASKKELIIESGDYCKCFVEVGPRDTLTDVRALIHEEFDDDMLPTCATFSRMMDAGDANANAAARDAFYFLLAGVRLSRERETRICAWDWVGQTVRILATLPLPAPAPAPAEIPALPPPQDEDENLPAAKRQRLQAPTRVTHVTSLSSAAASPTPRRSWKAGEDAKLMEAVKQHGKKWGVVAVMVPGRTDKQCRIRWVNVLDPANGKNKGKWTPPKGAKLIEAVLELGKDWVAVAAMVPSRTNYQCRSRWVRHWDPDRALKTHNVGDYEEL